MPKTSSSNENSRLIPLVPNDIAKIILGYLPAYSSRGKQSIALVSRAWAAESNRKKTSPQSIIESCRSKEDALNILADEKLYDLLNFNELLRIVACQSDMVEAIIRADKKEALSRDKFNLDQIAILISKNVKLIKELLISPEFKSQWTSSHLCRFACHHFEIANFILSDQNFVERLEDKAIILIVEANKQKGLLNLSLLQKRIKESVTLSINCVTSQNGALANLKNVREKQAPIPEAALLTWGLKFLEVAKYIVESEDLNKRLSVSGWNLLAKKYDFAAEYLSKNPQIIAKFIENSNDNDRLLDIALHQEIFAKYLITTEFVSRFLMYQLQSLVQKYPFFARHVGIIITTTDYKVSPSQLYIIAAAHVENAKDILQNPRFKEKLKGEHFFRDFIAKHYSIANQYLTEHPTLKLKSKAVICAEHTDLSEILFNEHFSELCGDALFTLAMKQPKIAEAIQKDLSLIVKMTDIQLLQIGTAHKNAQWAFDAIKLVPETPKKYHSSTADKTSMILIDLAKSSSRAAVLILNKSRFYQHLHGYQLVEICMLRSSQLPTVLKNTALKSLLTAEDIKLLCSNSSLRSAFQLLNSSLLSVKLKPQIASETSIAADLHNKAKELLAAQKAPSPHTNSMNELNASSGELTHTLFRKDAKDSAKHRRLR